MTPGNFICDIYMIIQQMVLNLLRWELNDSLSLEKYIQFPAWEGEAEEGREIIFKNYVFADKNVCLHGNTLKYTQSTKISGFLFSCSFI